MPQADAGIGNWVGCASSEVLDEVLYLAKV